MGHETAADPASRLQGLVLDSIVRGASASDTLGRLCLAVEEAIGAGACSVMLVGTDGALHVHSGPSLPHRASGCLDGLVPGERAGSCGTAVHTGEPAIVEDTGSDPRWADFQEVAQGLGIRSCWSYPIQALGTLDTMGSFAISFGEHRRFDAESRRVLETASYLAGTVLELERDQDTSELTPTTTSSAPLSEEHVTNLASAVERAFPGIARLDADGRFAMVRGAYAEMVGFEPEALIGRTWESTLHPEDVELGRRHWKSMRDKGLAEVELRGLRSDGSTIHARCLLVRIEDEAGRFRGHYCFQEDITERSTREERHQQLTGALLRLVRSDAFERGGLDVVVEMTTEIAAEVLGVARVGVWEFNEDRSKIRCRDVFAPGESSHTSGAEITAMEFPSYFEALEHTRLIAADDAPSHPAFQELAASYLEPHGIGAMMDAPIRHAGRTVGVICHEHVGGPRRWTNDERAFAASIAEFLATSMESERLRHATEALRVSEQRVEFALEGAGLGLWDWNVLTGEAFFNDRWSTMLGYEPGSIEPSYDTWARLVHPDDLDRAQSALREHLEGRSDGYSEEIRLLNSSDEWVWILTMGGVVERDEKGQAVRVVGIHRLIDEEKRAEIERQELESQLRQSQKLDAVGTLASGVAHDFNNLLTAVVGYAEIAKSSLPMGHPALEAMEMLERVTEQATGVTQSLLTFSHHGAYEMTRLDLAAVMDEGVGLLRHLLPASIELEERLDDATPLWIRGNATQLHQILMNLAINARDAMPDGGRLRVSARTLTKGQACPVTGNPIGTDRVVLEVSDTGTGMPSELASRVFEPFFTTKQRGKGTGLGLSIVHGIVTDHAGTVDVSSSEGAGTTFTIQFPHDRATSRADDQATTLGDGKSPSAGVVLIAEDNVHIGDIMVHALERVGFEAALSRDGDELVESWERHAQHTRLVILDLDLPKRSGLECADEIRRTNTAVPIILITGNVQLLAEREPAGNEHVLAKPFRMSELLRTIHEAQRASA